MAQIQKRNWALSWLTELLGFLLIIMAMIDLGAVLIAGNGLVSLLLLEIGLISATVGALLLYLGR